jgi:hypothetical protein
MVPSYDLSLATYHRITWPSADVLFCNDLLLDSETVRPSRNTISSPGRWGCLIAYVSSWFDLCRSQEKFSRRSSFPAYKSRMGPLEEESLLFNYTKLLCCDTLSTTGGSMSKTACLPFQKLFFPELPVCFAASRLFRISRLPQKVFRVIMLRRTAPDWMRFAIRRWSS